ncbi:VWA domain-containing protein [Kibdelosporangium persicum]|uniref:VWA domain-containing protein n=1 Tax=Kibdelosporangium persicum TaxID=2698649 RepID=A0ABX2F2P7_9PSEU|nr:VWA domain-containing protein [Kibdelosporangium persicum]NRN65604.1 VWA domain-containing protein [Kibdelosporangium persicum]
MNWHEHWPAALTAWGRFTKVHDPLYCESTSDARTAGLTDSFAMFRLDDRTVVLDMQAVAELGLHDMPVEVMAHEIGHHVLCPADLADNARLLARVRRGIPGFETFAPLVANLYADMLINDRLQRSRGLRMSVVYERIATPDPTPLWTFYMRTFEILWSLESGTLTRAAITEDIEGDAQLCARLVRVYATDWLRGAGGFAALCFRYLSQSAEEALATTRKRVCVGIVGEDTHIPGLTIADDDVIVHPALDPHVNEFAPREAPADEPHPPGEGQFREPFEYGQILRQLGVNISDETAAARYYRERAAPHLVRFPVRTKPLSTEPLPEGHTAWDIGEPLEAVDWIATATRSPVVIPGITTVQPITGRTEGADTAKRPVDLDLYVDSSGSMPDPRRNVSYLTLAGAILALSALRAGARVQATLWAGAKQFLTTDGFVRDENAIMHVLTGYFGGGTAFPIHMLRKTYIEQERAEPTHIVVISDDGVDTMVRMTDEFGRPGSEIAARSLANAGAGGTLVLNLWNDWEEKIRAITPGWDVHRVTQWQDLVDFAAAFSRKQYERSTA